MTPSSICAKYTFSDFFHFATPEEKKIVFLACAREASIQQMKVIEEARKMQEAARVAMVH